MPITLVGGGYLTKVAGGRLNLVGETTPWPSDVNTYARTGTYSEKIDTNYAEFNPEIGSAKRRRRMSISSETLTFSTWMKTTEFASFLYWYRYALADGALPFIRNRPRTGSMETFTFSGDAPTMSDVGYNLYEVQMTIKNAP